MRKKLLPAAVVVILVVVLVLASIAIISSTKPSKGDVKIGAYYYAWWGMNINNHWVKNNIKGNPFLGDYNSNDSLTADRHILWAIQHGISFFAVSWIGEGSWHVNGDFAVINQNLQSGLLQAPHMQDFNFCLLYETKLVLDNDLFDYNKSLTHKTFTDVFNEDMVYAAQHYFNNSRYLHVDGDPVLFLYNVPYLYENAQDQNFTLNPKLRDIHQLLNSVRQKLASMGENLYIIGDMNGGPSPQNVNATWLYSMNATTSYFFDPGKNGTTGWDEVLEDARTYYPQWQLAMNSKGIAFVPNVYPGFNNTNNTGVTSPTVLPRNVTAFKDMLETGLEYADSSLGIVMITSWNEWMEGTMIEPSMQEGELYLLAIYSTIPEFQPIMVLPLFFATTLAVAMFSRKKYARKPQLLTKN
jgi:hypothetical protein